MLGNNRDYKSTHERAAHNLSKHKQIMDRYIAVGFDREQASAVAMQSLERTNSMLAAINGRNSSYEITATKDDQRILVCYAQRHSGRGLRDSLFNRSKEIIALTGTDSMQFTGKGLAPVEMNGWLIGFSGRTRREAISAGELPFLPRVLELKGIETDAR